MRRLFPFSLALLTWLAASLAIARAQSVHWEPPGGTLPLNQTSEIQLVFENCEANGEPAIPSVRTLTFQRLSQANNTSIINGQVSRQETLNYAIRATDRAKVTIPSFVVETDKGRLNVPAASFDVGDATVGQNAVALDAVANARFAPPAEVWAGEVFPLTYSLSVARRYFYQLGGNPEWNSSPVTIEEWARPEMFEGSVNGEARMTVVYKTRGYTKSPGKIVFNGATQLVNLMTGTSNYGFFNRPTLEQYSIPSNRPLLIIKPLPANPPTGFTGAVGQFKLDSKVIPATASVGEPITWTLTLAGAGNWPDIAGLPARNVSKDFRVIQPQAKKTPKEGTLFDASFAEDVVLIPTKPGNYTLGPVTWSYFDPAKGEYQSASTTPVTITVSAPAVSPLPPAPTGASGSSSENPAAGQSAVKSSAPVAAPGLPASIPRDPLPGGASAPSPLSNRKILLGSLVPILLLFGYWFVLAWRRAQRTDPVLPQRKAHARLADILADLRSASNRAKIISLLQSWQRETAALWKFPRAVPSAEDFRRASIDASTGVLPVAPTPTVGNEEFAKSWAQLWRDADRVLYSAQASLPPDWLTRANNALAQKMVRPFSALQLFRFHNLLPFVALFIAIFFVGARLHAADAAAAYSKGDFVAAEKGWRETLAANSTDWIAHHNLALALAQQDRWPEAAAHATVAFVQHPRDPAVRWNFALALEQAGYTPVTLGSFLSPSPFHSVARLLSPAEWQLALIAAVTLGALGLGLWLTYGYGANASWLRPTGVLLIVLAVCTAAGAAVSLHLYSPARDAHAVLVWRGSVLRSVPTEADTTQKTTPLAAGSMASIEKTFLGWVRLVFPNGQTGWARQDDLVRLW